VAIAAAFRLALVFAGAFRLALAFAAAFGLALIISAAIRLIRPRERSSFTAMFPGVVRKYPMQSGLSFASTPSWTKLRSSSVQANVLAGAAACAFLF